MHNGTVVNQGKGLSMENTGVKLENSSLNVSDPAKNDLGVQALMNASVNTETSFLDTLSDLACQKSEDENRKICTTENIRPIARRPRAYSESMATEDTWLQTKQRMTNMLLLQAASAPSVEKHNIEDTPEKKHYLPLVPFMLEKYANIYNKNGRIGIYSRDERNAIISRFHYKRKRRVWRKKIRYHCRKNLAEGRIRVKGRFIKQLPGEGTPSGDTPGDDEYETGDDNDDRFMDIAGGDAGSLTPGPTVNTAGIFSGNSFQKSPSTENIIRNNIQSLFDFVAYENDGDLVKLVDSPPTTIPTVSSSGGGADGDDNMIRTTASAGSFDASTADSDASTLLAMSNQLRTDSRPHAMRNPNRPNPMPPSVGIAMGITDSSSGGQPQNGKPKLVLPSFNSWKQSVNNSMENGLLLLLQSSKVKNQEAASSTTSGEGTSTAEGTNAEPLKVLNKHGEESQDDSLGRGKRMRRHSIAY